MPDDARIAMARCRASLAHAAARAGLLNLDALPSAVRTVLTKDLIVLVEALRGGGPRRTPDRLSPEQRLQETAATRGRLDELVALANLADDASGAPGPGIWQLRTRDLEAAWQRLTPTQLQLVAEAAVWELVAAGWVPDTSLAEDTFARGTAPWLALEWQEPDR